MSRIAIWALFCVAGAFAQNSPVVVTIEGKGYTKAELEEMIRALPAAVLQNFSANKKSFLETLALMTKMAQLAEKEGLDKQHPHDYRLNYNRMQYLATALLNEKDNSSQAITAEQQKYFEEHKAEYLRAKTKVLYIAFNNNPIANADPKAKKPLTETEAREKATAILKQARAGGDFVALIRQNSDDPESRGKDGDFPPFRNSDQGIPANLRSAVFALKPAQFTDLIQQPNGFYIFRLESLDTPQFSEVQEEIYNKLRKERLDQWVESVRKSVSVQFNDEAYLKEPMPK